VQFGGDIFDKRSACLEDVGLSDFLQGGRVEGRAQTAAVDKAVGQDGGLRENGSVASRPRT
jgi:hypothetical protein